MSATYLTHLIKHRVYEKVRIAAHMNQDTVFKEMGSKYIDWKVVGIEIRTRIEDAKEVLSIIFNKYCTILT